jgi:membrane-associated phospholipid phosphatase
MKKTGVVAGILAVCAVLLAFYFDRDLTKLVSFLHNDIFDSFFLAITFVGGEVLVFFILTVAFLWQEHKRKWIAPLWAGFGVSAAIGFIMKILIHRARPFQQGLISLIPNLQEVSYSLWNFSFPSLQSMFVFSALPVLSAAFPKFKKFWIIFAVLVAFSRVYFGVHFFSDVVVGAIIGYGIGLLIAKTEKKNKFGEKVYRRIFSK